MGVPASVPQRVTVAGICLNLVAALPSAPVRILPSENPNLVPPPLRFIVSRQPIRTTLRNASSAPLRSALRCAEWALSRVPSVAARGKLPFKKHEPKRRRHDNRETDKTISRHPEMVSVTS